MVKRSKEYNWWKCLIVLTFFINLSCLFILIPKPIYHYEIKHIVLNNANMFEEWNVVNYICDDIVLVNNHRITKTIYASTSNLDTNGGNGECMFKIKVWDGLE